MAAAFLLAMQPWTDRYTHLNMLANTCVRNFDVDEDETDADDESCDGDGDHSHDHGSDQ